MAMTPDLADPYHLGGINLMRIEHFPYAQARPQIAASLPTELAAGQAPAVFSSSVEPFRARAQPCRSVSCGPKRRRRRKARPSAPRALRSVAAKSL
jgi:hypothetical protein